MIFEEAQPLSVAASEIGSYEDYAYVRIINADCSENYIYSLPDAESYEDHMTGFVSKTVKGVTFNTKTNTLTLKKFSGKVNVTVNTPKGGNAVLIEATLSTKAFAYAASLKKSGGKINKTKIITHRMEQPVDVCDYYVLYKTDGKSVDRENKYYEVVPDVAIDDGMRYILSYDALDSLGWDYTLEKLKSLASYYEAEETYKPENGGFVYATTETVYEYSSSKDKTVKIESGK